MMNLPGLKPSALPQMRAGIPDRGADPAFTDAMALKGGAGAVGPIPLPGRDFERRVADRIFMQCFGDWEDIGTDAWHRTFEFPSRHIHLDGAIAVTLCPGELGWRRAPWDPPRRRGPLAGTPPGAGGLWGYHGRHPAGVYAGRCGWPPGSRPETGTPNRHLLLAGP